MKKWEYDYRECNSGHAIVAELSLFGEKGWRVISISTIGETHHAFLEREIPEPQVIAGKVTEDGFIEAAYPGKPEPPTPQAEEDFSMVPPEEPPASVGHTIIEEVERNLPEPPADDDPESLDGDPKVLDRPATRLSEDLQDNQ